MKIKFLIPLSLIGLMFACSPATKLEKSWADPSFNSSMKPFTKVLVIAPLRDQNSQRIAEDKIVLKLKKGVVGVQSYQYLQPSDTAQKLVQSKLMKDGFDGIILMHLTTVEKSTSYTPGTYYGGYYGYHGYGYGGYYGGGYSPGYYSEDKTFLVETNFYSVKESKLLWSGTTSTLNPSSLNETLDQIIYSIQYELQQKGLIKK
ncbi:MAG: hypothetical protein WCI92_07765 [Bacteroidota bacterium]